MFLKGLYNIIYCRLGLATYIHYTVLATGSTDSKRGRYVSFLPPCNITISKEIVYFKIHCRLTTYNLHMGLAASSTASAEDRSLSAGVAGV
jgi:hypothetical protein